MATSASEVFDRVDPWTEEDFLALPEDRRVELLDGCLLVSPSARVRHQRMSFRLAAALDAAALEGFEVLEAINVRVGPGKILIPDVVVTTRPGLYVVVCDAADVALVVEITSPENAAADRAVKPQLYAEADIPHYLRVEFSAAGPHGHLYRAEQGRYRAMVGAAPGEALALTQPFPVTLDLAVLGAATRSG